MKARRIPGAGSLRALLAACLLLLAASVVLAQSSGSYDLTWSTVDGGGGMFSTGGSFSLGGTAGPPDTGLLSGGTFTLAGSFWPGGAAAPLLKLHLYRWKQNWAPAARPGYYKIVTNMVIHDQESVVASGVTVAGEWTLPDGSLQPKATVTNVKGQAKFKLKTNQAGTYQFCVTGMAKPGYGYDPGSNHVPACTSIEVGP